jgi:hypothetical protein
MFYFLTPSDQTLGSDKYQSGTSVDNTIRHLWQNFIFFLQANDCAERVDSFFVHCAAVPSRGCRRLQNLLNFHPFGSPISLVVEIERYIFLGKQIITLSPVAPIKLTSLSTSCPIISHSRLPIFSYYSHLCCATPVLNSMVTESTSNLLPTNPSIDDDAGGDSGAESTAMTTSSSLTCGASMMAKGEIPELTDFFKKTSVSEEELQAYHHRGWLTGNVLSSIPEVDVPTVHGSSIICLESHKLVELGLPPSKFLAAIMNYLGYSLVHFNVNAIAALSSFVMQCEC